MALGGGKFTVQNKVLPGSYINIVSAGNTSATVGDRGVVAIAMKLGKATGKVITLTKAEFVKDCKNILGVEYNSDAVKPLREIFCHAVKVYVYDMGDDATVSDVIGAFEPYDFNVLCAYTEEPTQYITAVKTWREDLGKKCQVVAYNQSADHEGVVNVASTVSDEGADAFALVAWVAGAVAGANLNESCTNMKYDGEYTIVAERTQTQLEQCIKDGEFVFHLVYGEIRVLEDINSLVTTTADKSEDFKANQTIRIVDQIANDVAYMFNTKFLGKIPNDENGRVSLKADIVKHHKQLEKIRAIENFDPELVTVVQGETKKSVVVTDVVTPVNCMSQLYMTVVIM